MLAFSDVSGLHPSKEKTTIYFGNVKNEIEDRISQATDFQDRPLPFRYMGMLMTAR